MPARVSALCPGLLLQGLLCPHMPWTNLAEAEGEAVGLGGVPNHCPEGPAAWRVGLLLATLPVPPYNVLWDQEGAWEDSPDEPVWSFVNSVCLSWFTGPLFFF